MEFYVSCSQDGTFINAVEPKERIADLNNWHLLGTWEAREAVFAALFPLGLFDESGLANYKLLDGVPGERTAQEKAAEFDARPTPLPSRDERLDALERAMLAMMMGGMPSV